MLPPLMRTAALLLPLAGCGQAATDRAEKAVLAQLSDPESAKFREVRECESDLFTGEVNAKNRFGGYTGFQQFFVDRGVVTIADEEQTASLEGATFVSKLVGRCAVTPS